MIFDQAQLAHVAHLARIRLEEQDISELASTIGDILQMMEQLRQTDTAGTEPLAHPLDARQRLRADQVTEPDRRDELMRCAPQVSDDHLYLVPKVID